MTIVSFQSMGDINTRILQEIEEMNNGDPNHWRNMEIEKVVIVEENLHDVSQLVVYQNTFPESSYTLNAQADNNEVLLWTVLVSMIVCIITTGMLLCRCCRRPKKIRMELQPVLKENKIVTLSDTLKCLQIAASDSFVIQFKDSSPSTIEGLTALSGALYANIVNKYDELETIEACETVVTQVDDIVAKINKAVNTVDLTNVNARKVTSESMKVALRQKQDIEHIKNELNEIRNGLSKIIYLDENKYKKDSVNKLRTALADNSVCVFCLKYFVNIFVY